MINPRPAGEPPRAGTELAEASDHELARALLDGDPAGPRVAWLRFSPMVRRILRRVAGPRAEVEDLVQEVFFRFFHQLSTLRDPAAMRAYLIAIAVRSAQHEARRARALRRFGTVESSDAARAVPDRADVEAQHALLRFYQVLDRVRERERTPFVLRFIEGMAVHEIAEALSVSAPTVNRRLTRAWDRVTFFAERDVFLVDYLRNPQPHPVEQSGVRTLEPLLERLASG